MFFLFFVVLVKSKSVIKNTVNIYVLPNVTSVVTGPVEKNQNKTFVILVNPLGRDFTRLNHSANRNCTLSYFYTATASKADSD